MRRKRLLLAVTAVLVLAGCGLDHGTITSKDVYYYTDQICAAYNKNMTCLFWLPYQETCYELHLKSGDKTGTQCVDPDGYARYQVGGQYP